MDEEQVAPGPGERILNVVWPKRPTTWRGVRERLVPELFNIFRLTLATVLGYAAGRWILRGPIDLTGALTALLVVQASARGSFSAGLGRVAAVLSGVGLALLFTTVMGLTWWSLALLIACALVIARVFRLGSASLEVPISAMLILGSSATGLVAETRVSLTVIGAVVGMLLPLLLPPAIPTQPAAQAVREAGERLAQVFAGAAEYAERRPVTAAVATEWFDDTQRAAAAISRARHRIRMISELRPANARAFGKADIGPILTTGTDALERCLLAARALFLVVSREAPVEEDAGGGFTDEVRQAFAVVLADVGACIDAYGDLVEAEAMGDEAEAQERFADTVEVLDETRAILTELMLVDPGPTGTWMMHASVLKAIDHILVELDLTTHLGRRAAWQLSQTGLRGPGGMIGPDIHNPVWRWSQRRLVRRASSSRTTDADVVAQLRDDSTLSLPVVDAPLLGDPVTGDTEPPGATGATAASAPTPTLPRDGD